MERPALINKIKKATHKAALLAMSSGFPMEISVNSVLVGKTCVTRNTSGFYDVIRADGTIIYKNLAMFDIAIIIAQRHNSGEINTVYKVIALEQVYAKHHTDMTHYLNCLKGAKRRSDIERMAILEDKFQLAEMLAKVAKDSISKFKRIK